MSDLSHLSQFEQDQVRTSQRRCLDAAKEILKRCEDEKRGLTKEEKTEYDKLFASSTAVYEHTTVPTGIRSEGSGRGVDTRPDIPMTLDQRFADLPSQPLPDGIRGENLDLRKMILGAAVGQWDDADQERRAVQAVGTDSLGGFLVPTPLSSRVIDLARNQAMVLKAGALTVPMSSTSVDLGRVSGDPTAYWRAESAAVTTSNVTFEKLTLTAKVCAVLVNTTVEFLEDAIDGGSVIENAIGQAIGLELDRVAIHGTGTGAEPEGVLNTSGVGANSLGTNGAAINGYEDILAAIADVKTANHSPNALMYAPRTEARLQSLLDGESRQLGIPTSVAAMRHLVTNQVSTAMTQGTSSVASAIIVGDWSQLLIGIRSPLRLEVFRAGDSNISKMEVSIRAYLRADVALRHAAAFSSVIGIIPV